MFAQPAMFPAWFNPLAPGRFKRKIYISDLQTKLSDRYLRYILWNCLQMNVIGRYWWEVNIGSGNGITWDNVDPDLCRQMASLGHYELINPSTTGMKIFLFCDFIF